MEGWRGGCECLTEKKRHSVCRRVFDKERLENTYEDMVGYQNSRHTLEPAPHHNHPLGLPLCSAPAVRAAHTPTAAGPSIPTGPSLYAAPPPHHPNTPPAPVSSRAPAPAAAAAVRRWQNHNSPLQRGDSPACPQPGPQRAMRGCGWWVGGVGV